MVTQRISLWLLSSLLLWLTPGLSLAQQSPKLLVLVSQRNAEAIAYASEALHKKHPQLNIQARSENQLWEMDPKHKSELVNSADMILGVGLYGPTVGELMPLLSKSQKTIFIFHSDQRLVMQSKTQGKAIFNSLQDMQAIGGIKPSTDFDKSLQALKKQHKEKADWLTFRRYWQAGGTENISQLLAWAFHHLGEDIAVKPPAPTPRLRFVFKQKLSEELPVIDKQKPLIAVIDHGGSDNPTDSRILQSICNKAEQIAHQCLSALAYWGDASVQAIELLKPYKNQLSAIIMLQDFVMGGGDGREKVSALLKELNVPVIKAIKQRDRTVLQHMLSGDGIAFDKVYYQIAMPELQGASQPLIIANAGEALNDELTGILVQRIVPDDNGIKLIVERIKKWHYLQTAKNKDKRVAIVYYNHPPGRHNIGADNLDVPASLWQILQDMKAQGYQTGELPETPEALLDIMQDHAVNLPNDAKALKTMANKVVKIDTQGYQKWFETLPKSVQSEMVNGPLGLLQEQIKTTLKADKSELAKQAVQQTLEEVRHLVEGVEHPSRQRALALIEQLHGCYNELLAKANNNCLETADKIIHALQKTGIEGLGGWGEIPGNVMTYQQQMLLPSHQFGNIFIGPQPPRGWEVNEELLHANLAFPPTHQYLAFYYYLQQNFKADAIVHLGRHSTYEFLPRRAVGLGEDDYSRIIAGTIPSVYPYIVDGVGEGIQAKRRGLAVMVDHLTPPLKHTALYDDLLKLRQSIESYEANANSNQEVAKRQMKKIRATVDKLELRKELTASMADVLEVRGIGFDEVDDSLLVHEIGHYLTKLQEQFMPMGLHIFGKQWDDKARNMMLDSMKPENPKQRQQWQNLLNVSPKHEMQGLLTGLDGGFIAPGPGNDPVRSPASLPTGRNFYALDNSLIPSPIAWEIGSEMAQQARQKHSQNPDKTEALVLWASDVVRDEGVMVAFGLDMLGLKPIWNSRGIVKGIERQPITKQRVRRDVLFTTSGLFRDLYSRQMLMLNEGVLLALDGSAKRIQKDYPALTLALKAALKPLHESEFYKNQQSGNEALNQNQVAAHWVKQTQKMLAQGISEKEAGLMASLRVFGNPPGSYSAGVARLTERSGAWENREEIAKAYTRRLGHSYGAKGFGVPSQELFKQALSQVENTYVGRSSNIYGLLDRNDVFDFLGGLSLAVETLTGKAPNNYIINNSDNQQLSIDPLEVALRGELRGRYLNPEWLKELMGHGYAGARTMGSSFLEYLWGWQVTNPTIVGDWAWQEVKEVYIDDRYQLELDAFLEQDNNVHVKSNMLAIMLVAIHKGFWDADEKTRKQLAGDFARLVNTNGLPGSGHTAPSNPMLPWLEQYVTSEQWQKLQTVIKKASSEKQAKPIEQRISELEIKPDPTAKKAQAKNAANESQAEPNDNNSTPNELYYLLAIALLAMFAGFAFNLRKQRG